ncbi:MAG: FAD-dependent oxidoreductase [Cyanophyceae cyanobacterium]
MALSTKPRVVIIGCGIVGATIAYELGRGEQFDVTVLERQPKAPAIAPDAIATYRTGTPGALGMLMGVVSQKTQGRAWDLREASLRRFHSLIPELESLTGTKVAHNEHGLLKLCGPDDDLAQWEKLAAQRKEQGWPLEVLGTDAIAGTYPQVSMGALGGVAFGIYSPQDWQVQPISLLTALVSGARHHGVKFSFGTTVTALHPQGDSIRVELADAEKGATPLAPIGADWLVVAAGLGSSAIAATVEDPAPLTLQPVLGQAARLQLERPMAMREPAITGDDVHVVPLGGGGYWVGATVEFVELNEGDATTAPTPDPDRWQTVLEAAIALCPDLASATMTQTWSGLRPRPVGQPAPIIQPLASCDRIWLATGHYRNGVLLAPATAEAIATALRQAAVA